MLVKFVASLHCKYSEHQTFTVTSKSIPYDQTFTLYSVMAFPMHYPQGQHSPKRELRGAWIATYANIDWPNRSQTPEQQKGGFHQHCGAS